MELRICNAQGEVLAKAADAKELSLVYAAAYQEGDTLHVAADQTGPVALQLDDAVGSVIVHMMEGEYVFSIPFGEKRAPYSPKAFSGSYHLLQMRLPRADELRNVRNLAQNPYDSHENQLCFPHASANVETRGEMQFAAKNAISGNTCARGHGSWPYASWGIGGRADAAFRIDFGRPVLLHELMVYERCDFPHDNWWVQGTFTFSDGSELTVPFVKTEHGQSCSFAPKQVEWLTFDRLIPSDDPSPFPALIQLLAFGREVE